MNDEMRNESEEERSRRRRARIEEMKRQKRRAEFLQRRVFPLAVAAVLILGVVGTVGFVRSRNYIPKDGGASQTVGGAAGDAAAGDGSGTGDNSTLADGSGTGDNGTQADGSGTGDNGTLADGSGTGDNGTLADGSGIGDNGTPADGSDRESSDSASVPMQQVGSGKTQNTVSQTISQGQGKADNRDQQQSPRQPEGVGGPGTGKEDVPGSDYGETYGPVPDGEWHPQVFKAGATVSTAEFSSEIISEYGVLIDVENKTIVAQRAGKIRMYPASMTKILTVLTAADALGILGPEGENSPVLDEKFTITIEITDYSFVNDCSNVGFEVGEEVTIRDLFYGTILPSGADAALGLAYYVSGSQEAFVELMNQELEKLNLLGTSHFTNCVGIYDDEHYSTAYDIAVILKTAADNPFCRKVLSARTYTTSQTEQHPEGMNISNWFLRRIEDKDTHGEMLCGKTGYVAQSKSCAASLACDVNGKEYVCVMAGSAGSKNCMNDHVKAYQTWLTGEMPQ